MNVPEGTWMVSMKVDNEEIYEKAKNGEVKGFSIEGYFADKLDMSSQTIEEYERQLTIEELKELLQKEELRKL